MKITKRNFLKNSAVTALTFGSSSALTPVRAAPTEAPHVWDEEFDMVIIGAGGGGLMAAHYAQELGLKAVVLEKLQFVGGSSALCGGSISVANTLPQQEKGIEDSDELFVAEMLKVGKNKNDPALVEAHVKSIRKVFDFIYGTLGAKPDTIRAVSGMSVPRAHLYYPPSKLIQKIYNYVKDRQKVPFYFQCPAKRLIWQNGRISGVLAQKNGKPFYVKANKGVLIATGGFQYNKSLMAKYNPLMAKVTPAGGKGSTGDGLLMAQAYGADVLDTNYIKATFGYQRTSHPNSLHAYYMGSIIVNHSGERFVDESISYKLLSDAALGQPDDFTFQLFDEKVRREMSAQAKRFAEILDVDELKAGKDTPYCFCGQTIEEVAKKAGVDPERLKATVTQYNSDVEKGLDSQFGRSSLTSGYGKMKKIDTPPFFLYPSVPRCIATYCGVKIDPYARVIDVFGAPIPGLYACGEVTGGVHGAAYMTGTAFGKAFSFGRLAALNISKNNL